MARVNIMVGGWRRKRIVIVPTRGRAAALLLTIAVVLLLHALALRGGIARDDAFAAMRAVPPALRVRSLLAPTAAFALAPMPAAAPAIVRDALTPDTARAQSHRAAPQRARLGRSARPRPAPERDAMAPAASTVETGAQSPQSPQLYPTLLPPTATLRYELRRGASTGRAELHWQHDSGRYAARFDGEIGGEPVLQWSSTGSFDAAGVAPERFVARGRRRSAQAVNFQRDAGKITYSGPIVEHVLALGAQDRLSWMVQLAAIVQARPPAAGERIVMQVAGPRGDADAWQFEVLGDSILETGAGPVQALRLVREPRRRYDTRIEVWLDPGRHHWAVRALLSSQDDGRDPLEWQLLH